MANDTDNFVKEVEEDLRREQIENLWERYGIYVVGAAVAAVLGVGGWKYFERQRNDLYARAGAVYAEASAQIEEGKAQDAIAKFIAISQEAPGGHGTLSTLRVLGNEVRSGRATSVIKHYDTLATDTRDPVLAGYARLQGGLLRLDIVDFTALANHLKPLVQTNSPWRYLAREAIALSAFKAKRFSIARQELDVLLADPLTPQAIKDRARTLLTLITEGDIAAMAPPKSEGEKGAAPKVEAPKVEVKAPPAPPAPSEAKKPEPPAPAPSEAKKPEAPPPASSGPLPRGVVPPRP